MVTSCRNKKKGPGGHFPMKTQVATEGSHIWYLMVEFSCPGVRKWSDMASMEKPEAVAQDEGRGGCQTLRRGRCSAAMLFFFLTNHLYSVSGGNVSPSAPGFHRCQGSHRHLLHIIETRLKLCQGFLGVEGGVCHSASGVAP